jgi:MFS family permease
MNYFRFVRQNRRFLAFGLLVALFSSFGQTYFIGLFSAELRAAFALSHGEFGLIYSLASLAAGLCLIWLGRFVDRLDLRLWMALLSAAAVIACIVMGLAPSVVIFAVALFLLRLSCQSLLAHTYMTSMARYFDSGRGKAISIAMLGHPLGEALLPLITITLLTFLGWRDVWLIYAAVGAVLFFPALMWLLRGHGERHRNYLVRLAAPAASSNETGRQWTQGEVLRDGRFYLIQIAMMAPPFMFTGLFIHQAHLAAAKGWSLAWLATCFSAYAATSIVASLAMGPLIDRIGASRIAPHALFPVIVSMLALALFRHPAAALIFMAGLGLCMGMVFTAFTAIWAELYGVRHLGAIRSVVMAIMVLVSAIAPAILGWLFDAGVSVETLAVIFAVWAFAGWLLLLVVLRHRSWRAAKLEKPR